MIDNENTLRQLVLLRMSICGEIFRRSPNLVDRPVSMPSALFFIIVVQSAIAQGTLRGRDADGYYCQALL